MQDGGGKTEKDGFFSEHKHGEIVAPMGELVRAGKDFNVIACRE
jgi:hypothetical protein